MSSNGYTHLHKKFLITRVISLIVVWILFYILTTTKCMPLSDIIISAQKNNTYPAFHSTIISVSAIFAGFLFTNIGIVLSSFENSAIKKIIKYSRFDVLIQTLITAIIFFVLSLILGLFFSVYCIFKANTFIYILHFIEFIFLFSGLTLFGFSMLDITFILKKIRENITAN